MAHGHHIEIVQEQFSVPAKAKTISIILAVVGLILTGVGFAFLGDSNSASHSKATAHTEATHEAAGHHDAATHEVAGHEAAGHEMEHGNVQTEKFGPRIDIQSISHPPMVRFWASLLIIGYYLLLISLAALMFVAIQYIANAGWSAAVKRVPEAIYTFVPVAFLVVFAVILIAKNDLYHWAHYEHLGLKKGDTGFDHILAGKSGFLNTGMLLAFPTILAIIFVLIGRKLRSLSKAEDAADKGETRFFKKSIRVCPGPVNIRRSASRV